MRIAYQSTLAQPYVHAGRSSVKSKCDVAVTEDNVKVLSSSLNNLVLRIFELLLLFKTQQNLNGNTILQIVNVRCAYMY